MIAFGYDGLFHSRGMQLQLFSRPKPLVDRFGPAFFRALPKQPGVYLMRDCKERLIYVGKATNLRQRVGSYRYVSERTSRRMHRLLSAVASITWEVHESEPAACVRENELLRVHRPKFNRANVYPAAYPFIELRLTDDGSGHGSATIRLTFQANEHCFGAFKGARTALKALLRLTWVLASPERTYAEIPRRLLLDRTVTEDAINAPAPILEATHRFLAGTADELIQRALEAAAEASVFCAQFRAADIETLTRFYERGPKRNRAWLAERCCERAWVEQERVNDLC